MRPKYLNFEQLVQQNREELMEDSNILDRIEARFEQAHMDMVLNKQKTQNMEQKAE